MPSPRSVKLLREEHAHYTKVCAIDGRGVVIDYYNTTPDDPDECTKLWVMEKRLNFRKFQIVFHKERVTRVNK